MMTTTDARAAQIRTHFDAEAAVYDETIVRLIPRYAEMIEALVSILPARADQRFSVVDLGCGTGTLSAAVMERFPHAALTCVDIAPNMLELAKRKLGDAPTFIHSDFTDFVFPASYDAIVSALALHHLESDAAKKAFYRKIHAALAPDGIFVNVDIVKASDARLQDVYMQKWVDFMRTTTSEKEITETWMPAHYAEDRPAPLMTHIALLQECGFSCIDVVYKYYNYAVYTAKK